jgi:hypothetical protein
MTPFLPLVGRESTPSSGSNLSSISSSALPHRQTLDVGCALELPPYAPRQQDALIGSDLDNPLLFNRHPILAETAEEDCEHPIQHGDIFRSAFFPVSPLSPHRPQVPFLDFEILAPAQIVGGYERSHHPAGVCTAEPGPDISGIEQHETMIVLVDSAPHGRTFTAIKS